MKDQIEALQLLVFAVAREELARALSLRVFDDVVRRALLHDHAAVHEDHTVGHVAGEGHLMRDDDHGHVLLGKRAAVPGSLATCLNIVFKHGWCSCRILRTSKSQTYRIYS